MPPLLLVTASHLPGAGEARARGHHLAEVARIGDRTITAAEMKHALRKSLDEIEEKRHETPKRWLQEQCPGMEAERRSLSPNVLLPEEVMSRISITREEIAAFYRKRRECRDTSAPESLSAKTVAGYLRRQKYRSARPRFIDRFKGEPDTSALSME